MSGSPDLGQSVTGDDPTRWDQPTAVDNIMCAFPASVAHLMPPLKFCEAALRELPDRGRRFTNFQARWFYEGISAKDIVSADGIDTDAALRHLHCIQGSYEPKREHKEMAVAYLASRWFVEVPA